MLGGLVSVTWILVIFILSTFSKPDISLGEDMLFSQFDKVVHFGMYLILQIILMWTFVEKRNTIKNQAILCFSIAYGISLEFVQHFFLADRFFEIFDIIANITGALSGLLLFQIFKT